MIVKMYLYITYIHTYLYVCVVRTTIDYSNSHGTIMKPGVEQKIIG